MDFHEICSHSGTGAFAEQVSITLKQTCRSSEFAVSYIINYIIIISLL